MDISSGWFAGRPRLAAQQLQQAAEAGFGGVALLPGDPPLELDGLERTRRATRLAFRAAAFDALLAPDQRPSATGAASADHGRQERATSLLPGALSQLAALGGSLLIITGGVEEEPGAAERGERILARLRAGEAVSAGDEALEVLLSAPGSGRERQLEALARFAFAAQRMGAGVRVALAAEASPAGLLNPESLALLLADPALAAVGYWHDSAVAEARSDLRLEEPGMWLDRFGSRMLGATLQDYAEGRDLLPPGQGKVDWRLLAEYMPRAARRVLALAPSYALGIASEARSALAGLGIR
ncbi:MAG: hypothetical protein EYC70_16600 [Planctomycetota bacterium]|nr:MAG: hypothetical protein EYC70_16600 [Planctomycetota bacterium]